MGRKSIGEIEARRNEVCEMLLEGKNKSFIVSYCATNWGVRLSAVEKDITAVRKELNKEFHREKQEIIAEHLARYENLYRFYMDAGTEEEPNIYYNPETAAKMLERKEKLLHLHNPNVVIQNNTQNNLNLNNLSLEELQGLLLETK